MPLTVASGSYRLQIFETNSAFGPDTRYEVILACENLGPTDTPTSTPTYTPTSTPTSLPSSTPTITPTTLPTATATPDCYYDIPEPDNSIAEAKAMTCNADGYTHYFCNKDDQDWTFFHANAGNTLRIFTYNLGVVADTFIYLYHIDQITVLATNDACDDEPPAPPASCITYVAPHTGNYYVLIDNKNGLWGQNANYDIRVECYTPTHLPTPTPVETAVEVPIRIGWTSMTLQVQPSNISYISEMMDQINSQGIPASYAADWTGVGWNIFQNGLPFNNFTIEAFKGYFIRSDVPGDYLMTGQSVTGPTTYSFRFGWNFIGIPHLQQQFTASILAGDINAGDCEVMYIANWTGQSWQIYQVGLPFNNFNIEKGKGYFLRMIQGGEWVY